MNRCKYCGAQIDWIHDSKQWVPVQYRPVVVRLDRGTENFITDEGEWIKGERTLGGPVGGNLVAFAPHWRYCPGQRRKEHWT